MDQESFRRLLQTPKPGSATANVVGSRGSLLSSGSKQKSKDASQPAFKPRKVKKMMPPGYRDRASERRVGGGNDYAEVEAVLEEFERQTADSSDKSVIEEKRKYLGGDSEHSILVKGLDFALLEQNKARAALSTEDDDSLEQAFVETVPKKRTREEILKELKEKRAQVEDLNEPSDLLNAQSVEAKKLEEAKKSGKFKPIGFKPVGGAADEKGKKKKKIIKEGAEGERKKKKRKIETSAGEGKAAEKGKTKEVADAILSSNASGSAPESATQPSSASIAGPLTTKPSEVEPPEDFDIFAGVGEYEGIDLGDDDDDEADQVKSENHSANDAAPKPPPGGWFATDNPEESPELEPESKQMTIPSNLLTSINGHREAIGEEEGEIEEPMRLQSLESSALPSIKDILAMDEAVKAEEKRKRRKDKKKGGKDGDDEGPKMSAEVKAERDYRRLKKYQEKKAAVGS